MSQVVVNLCKYVLGVGILSFSQLAVATDFDLKENKEVKNLNITGQSDSFRFFAEDFKSYCCEIWSERDDAQGTRFDTISSGESAAFTSFARGYASPILTRSSVDGQNSRRCFYHTATTDGRALVSMSLKIGVGAGTASILDGSVRCVETTLYGGFNTVVTDFNFIEISNTLTDNVRDNGEVTVVVKAFGTSGAEVLSQTFSIAAGRRQDVDVHSAASNDFGPVIIYHNGPPGAIRAVNAQYRIVTTSPLDFEPVLVVPFREGAR